ncbi:FixH family protein [Kordiimonas aestuarii]|uniref:FixH family protein n=1 Tax=Kordiimonas aestuarii TaxID=1005925 RepID=UPI0021CF1530|nr:FixH family protein [Kordiimonas aestuarii]
MSKVMTEETGMRESDRLIPWYIVAFFVVVAILDGIFVYIATSTHTGVITEQAYDKGLAYNDTVAAAEAQHALGWRGEIILRDRRELCFILRDKDGTLLKGAAVKAVFTRPTQDGMDFGVELLEGADGAYRAAIDLPALGLWDVRVFALEGERDFQAHKRLVVRPQ